MRPRGKVQTGLCATSPRAGANGRVEGGAGRGLTGRLSGCTMVYGLVGAWRSGSAPALGAGGRWFESSRPDHPPNEYRTAIPLWSNANVVELGVRWPEVPAEASVGVSVVVTAPVLDTAERAADLVVDPALRDAGETRCR
jgi:hypothetical protein